MVYSLSEAAKATGMTRQGVLAAIRKGRVSGKKNEIGEWEIDPAELHRVYAPVNILPETESKNLTIDDSLLVMELRARIVDLQQERDDWKDQARQWQEQAQRMLPPGKDQEADPAPVDRKGFFARLFGG